MSEGGAQSPVILGWCPGALRPMPSGDGLVVRVRPRGGRLTPAEAAGLARLALAHGNGLIDVSARANVQLRGVTEQSYEPLIAGLSALGLVDATPAAEAQRNIVISPFWSPGDGTPDLAAALAAALTGPDAPGLPGKFGFSVDCGTVPVLQDVSADIRFERGGDGGLICRADGALAGASVTIETSVAAAMAMAAWFVDSNGMQNGRGRMSRHLANGAVLPEAFLTVPMQTGVRFEPKPGAVAAGFLVGLEFGQMRGETLAALAQLGPIRLTPWRLLLIENVRVAPDTSGLIVQPDDPLLHVVACTGAPGCLQGRQPTRVLARSLASSLARSLAEQVVPGLSARPLLHVSGCAKGCAHPTKAAMTLTAEASGFALVRDGRADDVPVLRGLSADDLVARPQTLREAR